MIPLYLITQYGHPHCVKTPKASGTCKRPFCFLHVTPSFSLQDWSGGGKALSLERCGLSALTLPQPSPLGCFSYPRLFSALLMKSSLLCNTPIILTGDWVFWFCVCVYSLQILFLEDALALHLRRERWSGPFPQHRCPWRGGRKTQGVGFSTVGEAEGAHTLYHDIELSHW